MGNIPARNIIGSRLFLYGPYYLDIGPIYIPQHVLVCLFALFTFKIERLIVLKFKR